MKKNIKVSVLVMLAAVSLFIGCNHAVQEETSSKRKGLFNYNKAVTVNMEKADFDPAALADGKWVYQGIEEFVGNAFYVEEIHFTKAAAEIKITKYTVYIETNNKAGFKNPNNSEIKEQQKAMNQNKGIFNFFKSLDVKYLKTNKEESKFYAYAEGLMEFNGEKDTPYKADFYLMKK